MMGLLELALACALGGASLALMEMALVRREARRRMERRLLTFAAPR